MLSKCAFGKVTIIENNFYCADSTMLTNREFSRNATVNGRLQGKIVKIELFATLVIVMKTNFQGKKYDSCI